MPGKTRRMVRRNQRPKVARPGRWFGIVQKEKEKGGGGERFLNAEWCEEGKKRAWGAPWIGGKKHKGGTKGLALPFGFVVNRGEKSQPRNVRISEKDGSVGEECAGSGRATA